MPEEQKNYSIGVDIGGTKMSAVLFDLEKKEIVSDYKLATPTDNLDKFLVMLYALIDPLIERASKDKVEVEKIGMGIAGVMAGPTEQNKEGRAVKCPNLEIIENEPLGKTVSEKYNMPVLVDNDTNCFLRAEVILGAGKKSATVVGVTIGTGIGGAIYFNNSLYQGIHGSAGEIGHLVVDTVDGVGLWLETIYQNLTKGNAANMAEQAFNNDALAIKVFEEVGAYVGFALANVVNLIDPEIIIIGGSVMDSSDLFITEIKKSMKKTILSPKLKRIKVVKGKLENAGAMGAALL